MDPCTHYMLKHILGNEWYENTERRAKMLEQKTDEHDKSIWEAN